MQVLYVLLAILLFGILIFIHELGHYICARIFGVAIQEFAIGMGPKLLRKTSKKTGILYTVRLFPIGGFVNMGEDDIDENGATPAPGSFRSKPVWQRFVILSAGALMNLLLGVIMMTVIVISSKALASTTVSYFSDDAMSNQYGLMVDDTIIGIGDARVHVAEELVYEIMYSGYEPVDVRVIRNGEELLLEDVVFPSASETGMAYGIRDFGVYAEAKTPLNVLRHAFFRSVSTIKMIWQSLIGLFTGRYGLNQMSGPIGITGAITTAASQGFQNLAYLFVVISMNLGVFNLLPIPALDGGRLLFLVIELVRRKPVEPKYEAYVHFAGLCVLLLIIILISVKDIFSLFG